MNRLVQIGLVVFCLFSLSAAVFAANKKHQFDSSGVSREVLENYLSRAVTMTEFLTDNTYNNEGNNADRSDDIRLIKNIGAKFIGRSIYRWGKEDMLNDPQFLGQAKQLIGRIHADDPDIVFQACLFEIVTQQVDKIAIPAWVFEELGLPVEQRNFRYEQMLSADGKFVNHWRQGSSVPDITKTETQLWFIFLAGTYMRLGCEGLHLGQTALMGMNDPNLSHWESLIGKLRKLAKNNTRRGWVLLDAHTPYGGMVVNGKSLLDFNTFPLRIKEVVDKPMEGVLEIGYSDSLYQRSLGCMTPSGWACKSLPYMVEFDNFGCSKTPGKETLNSHFIWGYDEITWFYLQDEKGRKNWLRYAYHWLKEKDLAGFLQMPIARMVTMGEGKRGKYHADAAIEETIKELWR